MVQKRWEERKEERYGEEVAVEEIFVPVGTVFGVGELRGAGQRRGLRGRLRILGRLLVWTWRFCPKRG